MSWNSERVYSEKVHTEPWRNAAFRGHVEERQWWEADKESDRQEETESTVSEKSVGLLQKLVSHLKCFRESGEDKPKISHHQRDCLRRILAPHLGQSLWAKSAP